MDFGTPESSNAIRLLLLGSGELGKEVVIEAQRLGVEVIAVDRYPGAPAMQVAHRAHVINMLDPVALREVIEREQPTLIVPEIEAIHTPTLQALETEGFQVIPTARAARLTMDREGIRRLAAEELKLPTSPYQFVDTEAEYRDAISQIGYPFVIKPVMSSSGKGQSTVRSEEEADAAWQYAQSGGRTGAGRCIVEGFVPFDYEITLLPFVISQVHRFVSLLGIARKTATTESPGNPKPCPQRPRTKPSRSPAPLLAHWVDVAYLVLSCSFAATRYCFPKYRLAPMTLAWSR